MTSTKLELPGVYVVKVTDEKTLQATTLVIGSDLDAIVKTSRDQILVFAQDMKTGRGRAGARVLVADGGQVVLDGVTGADGVLLRDWKPAARRQRPLELPDPGRCPRRRLGTGRSRTGRHRADSARLSSTPTGRPIGPARRSRSAAWSARSRAASTRTSRSRSIASRSPTAAAG